MTQANIELLHTLREAGAAEAAARSVAPSGETATKADLARLSGRILTAVGVMVASQALAVAVLIAVLG